MSQPAGGVDGPKRLLFVVVITTAALLLFLVQPLVAKRILPWFGGTPGVWTVCLAFYQSTLFLGYAYAHLLIRFTPPRAQLGVHALAIAIAMGSLPVLPGPEWAPQDPGHPSGRVLAMLVANVGGPFLVLASTGPLLQAWFARRFPARSPYPLYAFSNAGSFAALLLYPFLLEPRLSVSRTGDAWSIAFAVAMVGVIACAWLARRSAAAAVVDAGHGADAPARPTWLRTALWLLLPANAVLLLMGVTSRLTLDIASVPFLWVIPLATYLATFVLCFASERAYRRGPMVALAIAALFPSFGLDLLAGWLPAPTGVWLRTPTVQIACTGALLFATCTILHGELYRLRPPARGLTGFYLCLSAGGALGGLFAGIAAPAIFRDYYESWVGLLLAGGLLLVLRATDPSSALHHGRSRWRLVGTATAVCLALGAMAWRATETGPNLILRERSFFGVHKVFEVRTQGGVVERALWNGSTSHGIQLMGTGRRVPTAYFGRATGLGLVLGDPARGSRSERIAVVGLGVGTIASYARAGDRIRFYELDPVVVRIARDDRLFHFLADSPGEVEVVVGDARLSLAEEQARGAVQSFDYLIIDAFASDAIPVHLLTVEAFRHYVQALAPGGLLGVHASSRHFELMPLVARVGSEAGLTALQVVNARAPRLQSKPSQWVWLSRDPSAIEALAGRLRERQAALGLAPAALRLDRASPEALGEVPVWTDDWSDLFGLLRDRGDG